MPSGQPTSRPSSKAHEKKSGMSCPQRTRTSLLFMSILTLSDQRLTLTNTLTYTYSLTHTPTYTFTISLSPTHPPTPSLPPSLKHPHTFTHSHTSPLLSIPPALSGGAIAGIVIGVLVLCAIGVGVRTHLNNKKKNSSSLLKNLSEHGFEEVRTNPRTYIE